MPYQSLAIAMAVIGTQAVLIQSEPFGSDPATWSPTHRIMGGDPCTYAPVVVNGKNTWPGCKRKDIMGGDSSTYTPQGLPPLEPGPVMPPLKFLDFA